MNLPEQLVVGRRGEEVAAVGREVHALDDVLVLQRELLLSLDGVPDLGGEVCGAGGGLGGVAVEVDAPDGALVALKGADPVAGVALAKHGLSI